MKLNIETNLLNSLLTLSTVIEARDAYTGGHTWRVSQYAFILADDFGLDKSESFTVLVGGLVHDLGKIGVPDHILNKKGPLNDTEYTMMKQHPTIGSNVIEKHPLSPLIIQSVTQHHERLDGKGYPLAKREDGLSIVGKIISIADAFDAMTSTRPYRSGMPLEMALKEVKKESGTQFDSALADKFVTLAHQGKLEHILGHCADNKLMLSCPMCGPIIAPSKKHGEGNIIACPSCTGQFIMHKTDDTFELEITGKITGLYVPEPDVDAIECILSRAMKKVKVCC
ncbi:MAG: HD domain-containing phosphohydrolase [Spirochaetota bacterium]